MPHIKELKARFDLLPMDANNFPLYQQLLNLDQSIFVPVMDQILSGRIDIEDLRSFFSQNIPARLVDIMKSPTFNQYKSMENVVKDNIIARFFTSNAIKESIVPLDDTDLKYQAAAAFSKATGIPLTDEQISSIITGSNDNIILQTQIENIKVDSNAIPAGMSYKDFAKQIQLGISDKLAIKPLATP
jgi:hypothetical protein